MTKFPATAMMLGVAASNGARTPPILFKKGLCVDTKEYPKVMEQVKLWLESTFTEGNYVWQQDGVPCHNSKKSQDWCFWPKEPSSPTSIPLTSGCRAPWRARHAQPPMHWWQASRPL